MVLVDSPNTLIVYSKRKALRKGSSHQQSDQEEHSAEANVREDSPNLNYEANMSDERLGNINKFTNY